MMPLQGSFVKVLELDRDTPVVTQDVILEPAK
jgi:hypothetical protein